MLARITFVLHPTTGAIGFGITRAPMREYALRLGIDLGSSLSHDEICLTSRGVWDATSITLKPSHLLKLTKTSFLKLLEENPSLSIKLLRLVVDRLSDLHFRIGELQSQTVEQRLAYALLSLSRNDPCKPTSQERAGIFLTHEELAQMINTRRQTVTSTLRRYADMGLISRTARSIDVISPAGLAKLFEADENMALMAC